MALKYYTRLSRVAIMLGLLLIAGACSQPATQTPAAQVLDGSSLDVRLKSMEQQVQKLEQALTELKTEVASSSKKSRSLDRNPDPNKVYDLDIEGAPARGPENATVTIVEFSCLQCPACASISQVLDATWHKNQDKVKQVFMHAPLIAPRRDGFPFHPYASVLHEITAEAQAQGKFWQMHDYIFTKRSQYLPSGRPTNPADYEQKKQSIKDKLSEYGGSIGMDQAKLESSLAEHSHQKQIRESLDQFRKLKMRGTPSIFINGKYVRLTRNVNPLEFFQQKIDEALADAQKGNQP